MYTQVLLYSCPTQSNLGSVVKQCKWRKVLWKGQCRTLPSYACGHIRCSKKNIECDNGTCVWARGRDNGLSLPGFWRLRGIWISLTEASQNVVLFWEQVRTSYVKKYRSLKADCSISTPGFDYSIAHGKGCTDHSVHSSRCLWLYGSSYSPWWSSPSSSLPVFSSGALIPQRKFSIMKLAVEHG